MKWNVSFVACFVCVSVTILLVGGRNVGLRGNRRVEADDFESFDESI